MGKLWDMGERKVCMPPGCNGSLSSAEEQESGTLTPGSEGWDTGFILPSCIDLLCVVRNQD